MPAPAPDGGGHSACMEGGFALGGLAHAVRSLTQVSWDTEMGGPGRLQA